MKNTNDENFNSNVKFVTNYRKEEFKNLDNLIAQNIDQKLAIIWKDYKTEFANSFRKPGKVKLTKLKEKSIKAILYVPEILFTRPLNRIEYMINFLKSNDYSWFIAEMQIENNLGSLGKLAIDIVNLEKNNPYYDLLTKEDWTAPKPS